MNLTDILMLSCLLFFVLLAIESILLILLSKKTNAMTELKAMMKRKTIGLFFNDDRSYIMKIIEPDGKLLEDTQFGTFILDGEGAYIDKKTRNPILVFNPNIASNMNVTAFKYSASLAKTINDDKALSLIRQKLADGTIKNDAKIAVIKENVVFSHLKKMLGVVSPHNITAEVSLKVARRTKDYGLQMAKYIMWMVILGGIIVGAILIGVYMIQNNPQIPGLKEGAGAIGAAAKTIPT